MLIRFTNDISNGYENVTEAAISLNTLLQDIGAGVEHLAETEYGAPTDEELRDAVAAVPASLNGGDTLKRKEELSKKIKENSAEFKLLLNEVITSDKSEEEKKVLANQMQELVDEELELRKEERKLNEEIQKRIHPVRKELLEKRNAAFRKALEAVGVEFADPETLSYSEGSNPHAVKSLKAALQFFPQKWVDASNDKGNLLVKRTTKDRAMYMESFQKKGYVTETKAFLEEKPEEWEPDPYDLRESEYSEAYPDGTWRDPASGTFRHFPNHVKKNGSRVWVKTAYTYHEGEGKPSGKGWEKVELYEEKEVGGHRIRTGNMVTKYRKPVQERRTVTRINRSELTVNNDKEVLVGDNSGMRVAMHEFAHRTEFSTGYVTYYEKALLLHRSGRLPSETGEAREPEPLTRIYPTGNEYGFKANFPNHYMGKVYKGVEVYEVLSMGMESLFAGTNGALAGLGEYKADPDYKRFLLGVLSSTANTGRY